MADATLLALLDAGTRRLVRTVDGLSDEQYPQPSLLPGWSRAHVIAHLTLNAEGLSAALEGVHEGRPVPMYASQESRDGDIVALATSASPSRLRDRFLASTTVIGEWVEELADNLADKSIERVPGGRSFPAGEVGHMRVREVEIHHADLGLDYTAADWTPGLRRPAARRARCGVRRVRGVHRPRDRPRPELDVRAGRSHGLRRRAALWHGGRRAGAPATD